MIFFLLRHIKRKHFNVPKLTKYYQFKLETESTERKKFSVE